MGTLEYTVYNNSKMVSERNNYIVDGHGTPDEIVINGTINEKRNNYIIDGHGQSTLCRGINCAADPDDATRKMLEAKEKYKALHSNTKGTNKDRTDVELVQFYLSLAEKEKLGALGVMNLTDEFIYAAGLDDFVCFHGGHINTPNDHDHLSVGAYSVDGSKKLCINKHKIYELRTVWDRVCVDHGLSIVDPEPEMLYHFPEYATWFEKIKAEGNIEIVPRDPEKRKMKRKKKTPAYNYKRAMQKEREKELQRYYYYNRNLRNRNGRRIYILIPKKQDESVVVCSLRLLWVLTGHKDFVAPDYKIRGNESEEFYFGKTDYQAQRIIDGIRAAREMNIQKPSDMDKRRQYTGDKITRLKQEIYRNEKVYKDNQPFRDLYNQFSFIIKNGSESEQQEVVRELRKIGANSIDDLLAMRDRDGMTLKRISNLKEQLEDAKRDYRDVMHLIRVTERTNYQTIMQPSKKISLNNQISDAANRVVRDENPDSRKKPDYLI